MIDSRHGVTLVRPITVNEEGQSKDYWDHRSIHVTRHAAFNDKDGQRTLCRYSVLQQHYSPGQDRRATAIMNFFMDFLNSVSASLALRTKCARFVAQVYGLDRKIVAICRNSQPPGLPP